MTCWRCGRPISFGRWSVIYVPGGGAAGRGRQRPVCAMCMVPDLGPRPDAALGRAGPVIVPTVVVRPAGPFLDGIEPSDRDAVVRAGPGAL